MWKSISGVPVNGNQWLMWKSHKVIHYCPLLFGYGIAQKKYPLKKSEENEPKVKIVKCLSNTTWMELLPPILPFLSLFETKSNLSPRIRSRDTHNSAVENDKTKTILHITASFFYVVVGLVCHPKKQVYYYCGFIWLHVISNQGSHSSVTENKTHVWRRNKMDSEIPLHENENIFSVSVPLNHRWKTSQPQGP